MSVESTNTDANVALSHSSPTVKLADASIPACIAVKAFPAVPLKLQLRFQFMPSFVATFVLRRPAVGPYCPVASSPDRAVSVLTKPAPDPKPMLWKLPEPMATSPVM